MTELYRGLLQILVQMCIQQIESLRSHIRSHNTGTSNSEFDIGVTGFWNFMLEITFTLFSILFLIIFVSITALLAVVSYPPAAFINYGGWLIRNTKNPNNDTQQVTKDLQIIKTTKE